MEVTTTPKGIVVTEEVEAAARQAIASLPKEVMDEVVARMGAEPIARHWDIPPEAQAEWRAGRVPEPTFHVVPYWG